MKYDKYAILNTANRLKNKASGLSSIQSRLGNISPQKCNSNFYSKRYSLVKRIRNVQSEINSLSNDINSAANKMSGDDVQNAKYIRQVFNNRASLLPFENRGFGAGGTGLSRTGIFGGSMVFSSMALNRRNVSSLGKSTSMADVWTKLANKFKSGATDFGNTVGEFGKQVYNASTTFFSNVGKWASDRWNDFTEWGNSAKNYVWKSIVKFVLGEYDENNNITVLSFAANIITGLFDLDLPLDIRDLVYDVQHWGEGDNFGFYFALDCVALLPVIGVVKYFKYADDVADGVKDLGKVIETGSEAEKTIDNINDAVDNSKDLGKAAETAEEAGKTNGKNVDDVADSANDIRKRARKAAENYNLSEERYVEHILDNHGPASVKPKKSKFKNDFDIRKGIKDTVTDVTSDIKPNTYGRAGYIFEKVYKDAIGVAPDGTLLYKLKVVMDEAGNIVTAYPIK